MAEEKKRCRVKRDEHYWSISIDREINVVKFMENLDGSGEDRFYIYNQFLSKEKAQSAADDVKKVLLRHTGELHDFTWALDKLRQGYKVRGQAWHPERYLHYFPSRVKGLTYPYDSHSGMCEGFVNGLEFTDWEIYEDKE